MSVKRRDFKIKMKKLREQAKITAQKLLEKAKEDVKNVVVEFLYSDRSEMFNNFQMFNENLFDKGEATSQ